MFTARFFTLVMLLLCVRVNTQPTTKESKNSCSSNLEHRVRNLEYLLENEQRERARLEVKLQQLQGDIMNASYVAFSARMDVVQIKPNAGDIVPFNTVVVNQGRHFDNITSKFTCPKTGMYHFVFNFHSILLGGTDAYHTSAELVVNDKSIVSAHCLTGVSSGPTKFQCGQSAVVQCSANEQVWVQAKFGSSGNVMYGTDTNGAWSSFSGFLLFQLP